MSPAKSFLTVHDVSHRYERRTALHECTLSLAAGQVLGLAGGNGAGKTTLAKLITGFLRPSSGRIFVDGSDPTEFRRSFGVGYLPEELSAFGNCTPLELLRVRQSVPEGPLGIDAVVQLLDLGALLHRPLRTLSKGQRRLTLTAYAVLGPSRLIVLDEPDSGLDPTAVDRLNRLIETCGREGAAVVVLSHQLYEMEVFCDWIAFIRAGRIAACFDRATVAATGARNLYRQYALP